MKATAGTITIESHLGPADDRSLAYDVLDGLTRPFKELPPKHFYDSRGAELFDRICELPEYYPTRTEIALLARHGREMAECIGAGADLVEYGAGSMRK
jgi:L-histidine N-alpha-methyltransferase